MTLTVRYSKTIRNQLTRFISILMLLSRYLAEIFAGEGIAKA
jgi:hypothetical protein